MLINFDELMTSEPSPSAIPDYLNQSRKTLWSVATLITLGLYAGITAWWLHNSPTALAQAAPAAMMIELAATPVAQAVTEDLQVAPDKVVQQQQSTPLPKPPKEAVKKVIPVTRPTPARQASSPLRDAASGSWSSTPEHAPQFQAPAKRQDEQAASSSATTAPPKLDTQPARTTAASQSSRASADPAQQVQWEAQLVAHLERFKRYPQNARDRGDRGVAYLRFEIDSDGKVLSTRIVRSAGFTELDQATLDMISRASPVPCPPEGSKLRFTVPVVFAR